VLGVTPPSAYAVPTTVTSLDTPKCDVLSVPTSVDELGTTIFPLNELISSKWLGPTPQIACPMSFVGIPSQLIEITNLTSTTWSQVWYAGNSTTAISNDDGLINQEEAFLINNLPTDMNNPLIFESGPVDNMFQPGETWRFIIDGYGNPAGQQPHVFDQIGVPDPTLPGMTASGNIVAVPLVPEPSTGVALVALGACALLARRRSR